MRAAPLRVGGFWTRSLTAALRAAASLEPLVAVKPSSTPPRTPSREANALDVFAAAAAEPLRHDPEADPEADFASLSDVDEGDEGHDEGTRAAMFLFCSSACARPAAASLIMSMGQKVGVHLASACVR